MGEREEGRIPGSDKGANCVIEIYFFFAMLIIAGPKWNFLIFF